MAIDELLNTESKYLADMSTVVQVYGGNFRKSAWLFDDVRQVILYGLDDIVLVHQMFAGPLQVLLRGCTLAQ
jgi:hypothetical protein